MKRKPVIIRFGFISLTLFALLVMIPNGWTSGTRGLVDADEADAIADLWYGMELNSGYLKISENERIERLSNLEDRSVFYLVSKDVLLDIPPTDGETLAYVIKYVPTGYVIVSGNDRIQPIIAFGFESEFRWDNPEMNFLRYFLGRDMETRWEHLDSDVHPNWIYLRTKLQEGISLEDVEFETRDRAINIVWNTALWDQGWPYNEIVAINNGNNPSVPTGCTATAMAIKMRFHEWPNTGSGSHNYNDVWGLITYSHSANFGTQTYNWNNMPVTTLSTSNLDVATLMYHCGIAVDMNYESGASGAWPSASATNTYFRYKGTIEKTSSHFNPMRDSIRGGLPVVLSTVNHTVVADGYRDTMSPYFHLNCGWSGGSNGWYNLDQIPGGIDHTIDRSYPYSSPNNYIYVDSSWTGVENGNLQNPYNTLSEGVSSVPTNGHLWLKGGTYSEAPTTISKAMTIRSYVGNSVID